MPVDLPVRKTLVPPLAITPNLENWALMLAVICFTVALAGLVTHAPKSYRVALTAAVYEAMLQSP